MKSQHGKSNMNKLACNVIIVNVQHYINGIYYRGNRYHPLGGPPGSGCVERVEAWSAWLPVCLPAACCLSARGVGAKLIFVSVIVCLLGGRGDY